MPELDDFYNKNALIQLPEDSEFKIWARDHLQTTYLLLLINRFPDSLFEPFRETFFPTWYSGQNHWIDIDYQPLLSERILEYLQFDQWDLPLILMTLLIAVFTLISVIRNKSEIGFTALILLLISVTQFILNWHSDAGELERHSLLASIEFKLAFLFGLLCTLDLLIAWSKKPFSLLIQSKL